MTAGPGATAGWTYNAPPEPGRPGGRRRTVLVLTAVVAVAVIAALVTWLVWPTPPVAPPPTPDIAARPMLNDQPPTVIVNGLDQRSLYPPGYVDFDLNKNSGGDDASYDPNSDYDVTSQPPDCTRDPLIVSSDNLDNHEPDRYRQYPVIVLMYPVADPGGSTEDTGFSIAIWPASNPANLNEIRDHFVRCFGAVLTLTEKKGGQVVKQTSNTMDTAIVEAPPSHTVDSFGLADKGNGKDSCNFVGLTRGMIAQVSCPTKQREAGINLYRTVIDRLNAI